MKKAFREQLLRKRDRISPALKEKKEAAIRRRLFASAEFRNAKNILFYASFRSEVDTMACIDKALSKGIKTALPRVMKAEHLLKLYLINSRDDLVPGTWGIPEPDAGRCEEVSLDSIDTAIVPGAGFDTSGNRIGYGAGYYDKLLSDPRKRPVIIALAFEEQMVPSLPGEVHDVRMDKIITDKRTIDCRKVESRE